MKHLFIINPAAYKVKGRHELHIRDIEEFFHTHEHLEYDIHITRWERDALGFIQRYAVDIKEPLRVHSMGGTSTLYEVINGVFGLPNVEIAAYPLGRNNCFLRYFGMDKINEFMSLQNQVLADVVPMDALRCGNNYALRSGNNYGIAFGSVGQEAYADRDGMEMIEKYPFLPNDFVYIWAGLRNILKNKNPGQNYSVNLDGKVLDGSYATILVANGPCYGKNMNPAIDAHPNDGFLDVYLSDDMPRLKYLTKVPTYVSGGYKKLPRDVHHFQCKKISIASETVMCICVDGGTYYENFVEYEILPGAISFACPQAIDLNKIPRIYSKTKKQEGW